MYSVSGKRVGLILLFRCHDLTVMQSNHHTDQWIALYRNITGGTMAQAR